MNTKAILGLGAVAGAIYLANNNPARTKVKKTFGLSGVYDPGILKCVFMAGGTGSGKSYVARQLFGISKNSFVSSGLKIINSDLAFERGLKEANIDSRELANIEKNNPKLWQEIGVNIRGKAKDITSKQQKSYESGKLGMLVDGTGDDYSKIKKKKELAEINGYDSYMVFVNTSLDVALQRNRNRQRRLSDEMVREKWLSAQYNKNQYKKLFGNNFIEVENSKPGIPDVKIQKAINRFLKEPIRNPIGKKWIKNELNKKVRY
jgi:predicted kinase